jgi:hypothetical protein
MDELFRASLALIRGEYCFMCKYLHDHQALEKWRTAGHEYDGCVAAFDE